MREHSSANSRMEDLWQVLIFMVYGIFLALRSIYSYSPDGAQGTDLMMVKTESFDWLKVNECENGRFVQSTL